MIEDWKYCKFAYHHWKDDGDSQEWCPCEILSIYNDRFLRIKYYILVRNKKRELIDVIVKETLCMLKDLTNNG